MHVTRRDCLLGMTTLLSSNVFAAASDRNSVSSSRTISGRIDAICRAHISSRETAGLTVYIQRKNFIFARSYGYENFETKTLATPASVFRIASITKQFTAASLLLLQEEGRLSLDDPLARFLPRFPRAADVSLRELLNHTAGVHNFTQGIDPCKHYSLDQMIDIIAHQNPLYDFPPGTKWAYSNSGYVLAGAVIERVTGMPYWDFYSKRLFRPLGLTSLAIDRHRDIVLNRASGYAFARNQTGFENAMYLSWTIPGPAGALRSTAGDLARWHQALFGGHVLRPRNLRDMITPSRLKDGRLSSTGRAGPAFGPHPIQEYGLGFELTQTDGFKRVGHYGAIPGFAADMGTYPSLDLTIVVLTNSDLSSHNPPRQIDRAVLTALSL